jgi:hypothetical protein
MDGALFGAKAVSVPATWTSTVKPRFGAGWGFKEEGTTLLHDDVIHRNIRNNGKTDQRIFMPPPLSKLGDYAH